MYSRITESMGELLTEDEAKELVNRAIDEGLFKPRYQNVGYGTTKELPSEFVEMVNKQIKPLISKAIEQWIAENREVVLRQIDESLSAGVVDMITRALTDHFRGPLFQLKCEVESLVSKLGA